MLGPLLQVLLVKHPSSEFELWISFKNASSEIDGHSSGFLLTLQQKPVPDFSRGVGIDGPALHLSSFLQLVLYDLLLHSIKCSSHPELGCSNPSSKVHAMVIWYINANFMYPLVIRHGWLENPSF